MVAEPTQNVNLQFDLDDFDLGELCDIEDATGFRVTDLKPGESPPLKVIAGMIWIMRRRENPTYTFEQVRRLKMDELADTFPKGPAVEAPPKPEPIEAHARRKSR